MIEKGDLLQVFQPYEQWNDCARYLAKDPKRLNKQAVELYQIYRAVYALILGQPHGYCRHPMVLHIYHDGRPYNLFPYLYALNREWICLGYRRSAEFIRNIQDLEKCLAPYFTSEPYQPYYCKSPDYSYDDVFIKYQKLLHQKWGITPPNK